MEARPVELPYGLSSHHQHASRTGRSLALQYGLSTRWYTPSLSSRLQTAVPTAYPAHTQDTARPESSRQQPHHKDPRATDFGIAVSAPQTPPDTSQCQILAKPDPTAKRPAETGHDHERLKSKARTSQPSSTLVGSSTGPFLNIPITIDSSDEMGPKITNEGKERQPVKKRARTQRTQSTAVASKYYNSTDHLQPQNPASAIGEYQLPGPIMCSHPVKTSHITVQSTQTIPRVADKRTLGGKSTYTSRENCDTDDAELELKDIEDFGTRAKVAQLMAVAPAFSVSELYHLLIEKRGRFESAKEDIMPKSPSTQTKPLLITSEVSQPSISQLSVLGETQNLEDDEAMVKIDWDDPDLLFDNEALDLLLPQAMKPTKKPSEETPQPKGAPHPKKQQTRKQPQSKTHSLPQNSPSKKSPPKNALPSRLKVTKATALTSLESPPPPPNRHLTTDLPQPIPRIQTRSATHARANTSVKRTAQIPARSNMRKTSNDSDFLVPDEYTLSSHIYVAMRWMRVERVKMRVTAIAMAMAMAVVKRGETDCACVGFDL